MLSLPPLTAPNNRLHQSRPSRARLEAVVLVVADDARGQGVEGEEVGDAAARPLHHVRVHHVRLCKKNEG